MDIDFLKGTNLGKRNNKRREMCWSEATAVMAQGICDRHRVLGEISFIGYCFIGRETYLTYYKLLEGLFS